MAQIQTPAELEKAGIMDDSPPSSYEVGTVCSLPHASDLTRDLDDVPCMEQNVSNGLSSRWVMASDFIAGCVGGKGS